MLKLHYLPNWLEYDFEHISQTDRCVSGWRAVETTCVCEQMFWSERWRICSWGMRSSPASLRRPSPSKTRWTSSGPLSASTQTAAILLFHSRSVFITRCFPCLRHSSDRVSRLEAMVETYKRKLEDLGDLRRQVRLLEERNHVYMQRTCELEEELRRANAIRSQLDTYKRQVSKHCFHWSSEQGLNTS